MFESLFVAAVLGAGGPPATLPNPTVAPAPRAVYELTAAYHLRNVAAADVAVAVGTALGTDREFRIRPVAAENQLVVTGTPATHARVAALVSELDRAVPQVHVTMLIAEVPVAFLADCGLTAPGGAAGCGCYALSGRELALFQTAFRHYPNRSILSRPQLLVRDNQTGNVRVGQDFPVGAAGFQFAGVSAGITPRLMPDGKVMLRVGAEVSVPSPTPAVVRVGAAPLPINIQTVQTTTLVASGQTVVIATPTTGADGKPAAMLFVLTPAVVRP